MGIQNPVTEGMRAYSIYSLSPMGIQNERDRKGTPVRSGLTIPHGDSKLRVRTAFREDIWAHYPPWGFKTVSICQFPTQFPTSLSPMGIQN